jgi:hypothetical protein
VTQGGVPHKWAPSLAEACTVRPELRTKRARAAGVTIRFYRLRWRLRLWARQLHGRNARHPTHHLSFTRVRKPSYFTLGARIGNRQERAFANFTPTANKFAAQFDEINWPVVFVLPFHLRRLRLILVNLYDRSGSQQRIHRETGSVSRRNFVRPSLKVYRYFFLYSTTTQK